MKLNFKFLNNSYGNKFSDENLIGLDIFRFFLSITILIVHFPQFVQSFLPIENFEIKQLPFFSFFSKLYLNGGFAVQLFWMLSGVIFSNFYYNKIEKISFVKFFYLRITRLYPIHFITLILVLILQTIYYNKFGYYFLIKDNDIFHILLNIFLINYWNIDFNLSLNAPFWSVSVEIFTYIVFYNFVSSGVIKKEKNLFFLILCFIAICVLQILPPFNECLLYFFSGVFLVRMYEKINFKLIIKLLSTLIVLLIFRKIEYFSSIYLNRFLITIISLIFSIVIIYIFSIKINKGYTFLVTSARKLSNLTYSMYMIHFSIQLILLLLFKDKGLNFFINKTFFCFYLFFNVLISHFVYNKFELPIQNFLRNRVKIR